MTSPNDVTILRFYLDDNPNPRLSTQALQSLASNLLGVTEWTARAIGIEIADGVVSIVAPPRRGCLEILIQPDFALRTVDAANVLVQSLGFVAGETARAIDRHAGVLTLLWTVTFGGNGVYDLWINRGRAPRPTPSAPVEAEDAQVRLTLSQRAAESQEVTRNLMQLMEAARSTGMNRVTIEVTDSPEVDLYHADMRRRRGLIGAVGRKRASHSIAPENVVSLSFWHHDAPQYRFNYHGKIIPGYSVTINPDDNTLVLWPLKDPPPQGQVEVRGWYIDPDDLEPLDDVNDHLEHMPHFFLVKGRVQIIDD